MKFQVGFEQGKDGGGRISMNTKLKTVSPYLAPDAGVYLDIVLHSLETEIYEKYKIIFHNLEEMFINFIHLSDTCHLTVSLTMLWPCQ